MEVKVGVQHSPRELVLDTTDSQDEVERAVTQAIENGTGVLRMEDERGRRVVVPIDKVAYVEIGEADHRPVGFVTGLSS